MDILNDFCKISLEKKITMYADYDNITHKFTEQNYVHALYKILLTYYFSAELKYMKG